jgi:Tol biopolymer transport system component
MSRGQLTRLLIGVVAVTALAAVVVASPSEGPGARLRSGAAAGGGDFDPPPDGSSATEPPPTTSMSQPEATASTSSSVAAAVAVPTTARRTPSTTSSAVPTTSPPASGSLPAATLDPGEPVCAGPPEGGLLRGDVVALARADGIHEVALDGTRDVLLPGSPRPDGGPFSAVVWSQDGRRIAYTSRSTTRQDQYRYPVDDLTVVDLATGCRRLLTRSGTDRFGSPGLSPDGERVSYVRSLPPGGSGYGGSLETARFDGTDVRRLSIGAMGGSWAPDRSGRIAFGQNGKMSVVDQSGTVSTLDTNPGGAEYESWSPDAKRVVYTISVHQAVWVAQADGSGVKKLAPPTAGGPSGIWWSRFSPDSDRIVFNWQNALWITDVDGSNQRRLVEKASTAGGWFTPDGKEVLYPADGGLYLLPVDGSAPPRLFTSNGSVLAVFRRI